MSNLIICPDCGKEISASAKQCPNCGCPNKESDVFRQDINSDFFKKNPGCIAIAIIIFLFLFVSFIEGFEEGKNKKAGITKEKIYSVGETVSIGSWNYKVNKYGWDTVWFKKKFVVNISIKNTAKNSGALLPFSLIDEKGNRFTDYEVERLNSLATGETIQPSLEKTGNLYFNVPEDRKYKIELRSGIFFEGAFLGDVKCVKLYDENKQQSSPKGNTNKVNNNNNNNNTNVTKKVITTTFGDKTQPKENKNNKIPMKEQSQPENLVNYDMDNNKIFIDLNNKIGDYALGAASVVKDFYANYLNHDCRIDNWETNKNLMPITRQIFLMLKFVDFDYLDYDFIVNGQDYGNTWKINRVQINRGTALVGVENSFDGKEPRNIKILCKYVNGKWFIDDIEDAKKVFYSYLNGNLNLGVVNSYELPIFSKKYKQQIVQFYDIKNRIIPIKFNSLDSYQIISSNNLDNKIDSKFSDSEWFVKSKNIIPFNFFNKIRKGESKYLAYIVLGEPSEDSSNKLFYSPNDYISYDKEGKITSWNGFEDFKDYFDDGTGSNNQNIGYVNAKSGINLRKEPSTKSEKVCGFPYNTKVMIIDKSGPQATFEKITSNWYLITDGTRVGWAFGGFIKDELL